MKVNFTCNTDGKGLWSRERKEVKVHKIGLNYRDDEYNFGELIAYFNQRTWRLSKHGLIYTDKLWIKEFRNNLKALGFSEKAVSDIDFSEQGMQGDNYVSMDVGKYFLNEWDAKMGLDANAAP